MLLVLLRRRGPWKQNGRLGKLQPAAEELLGDFWRARPHEFDLWAASEAMWRPPYGVLADGVCLRLPVRRGIVDLGAVAAMGGRFFEAMLPELSIEAATCTLHELLEADPSISQCQCKRTAFLPQLSW